MERVLLGMSGGVDSSVAAILLQEAGYEVIGVTMTLWESSATQSGCFQRCSPDIGLEDDVNGEISSLPWKKKN